MILQADGKILAVIGKPRAPWQLGQHNLLCSAWRWEHKAVVCRYCLWPPCCSPFGCQCPSCSCWCQPCAESISVALGASGCPESWACSHLV